MTETPLSLALAGDCLLTRRLAVFREPEFLRIRELLAACDARFVNLEASVHEHYASPFSQHNGRGVHITTEPALLDDLRWLGVNLLSCGSTHADDYGWAGIMETIGHLDRAGIVHAGSGRHLAEARSPAYLDTAHGRVALIAANASFNAGARAGEQRRETAGHPGVNGFRHRAVYEVTRETMADLRRVGEAIGLGAAQARERRHDAYGNGETGERYEFLGRTFVVGDAPGLRTYPEPSDLEANLRQVAEAREMADCVIVSLHSHDQGGRTLMTATQRNEVEDPADYAIELARRSIDAGADVFVGHGPQLPMAIELYRGKPIFHGLGAFVFEIETLRTIAPTNYERYGLDERATPADYVRARYANDTRGHTADPLQWEQLFAVCEFAGRELKTIRLHPLDLGFRRPRSQRGRPVLAGPEIAERVIARVARLSARYGTRIAYRDGAGVVDVAASAVSS